MIKLTRLRGQIKDEFLFSISNFTFDKGKSYVLMGENGSGKSSLLKSFIGLFPYVEGKIQVGGDIIYQAQDPYLYRKTARDNFRLFDIDIERIQEPIQALDLGDSLDKPVDVLSGGQGQKLAFLRSLSLAKEILLLDEPFSQMDEEAVPYCISLLESWMNKDRTLIVVSHDDLSQEFFDMHLKLENKELIIKNP